MDICDPKPPIESNLGFESGAGWVGAVTGAGVVGGGLEVENSMADDTVILYARIGSILSSVFPEAAAFSTIAFSIRNLHFQPLYSTFGNSNPSNIYFDSTAVIHDCQPDDCATHHLPPSTTHRKYVPGTTSIHPRAPFLPPTTLS